jgi:hypothetical protein
MVAQVAWRTQRPLLMTDLEKLRATVTDIHFLIPLIVFGIGLALLITLH